MFPGETGAVHRFVDTVPKLVMSAVYANEGRRDNEAFRWAQRRCVVDVTNETGYREVCKQKGEPFYFLLRNCSVAGVAPACRFRGRKICIERRIHLVSRVDTRLLYATPFAVKTEEAPIRLGRCRRKCRVRGGSFLTRSVEGIGSFRRRHRRHRTTSRRIGRTDNRWGRVDNDVRFFGFRWSVVGLGRRVRLMEEISIELRNR